MPNNLFITGTIRIGKSTLLKEVIDPIKSLTGGFFVQRLLKGNETYGFRLVDIAKENYLPNLQIEDFKDCYDIILLKGKENPINYGVFKRVGVATLTFTREERKLILMDELGIMETEVPEFTEIVCQTLDKDTPVIGVLKKKSNPFLDKIRARSDVQILDMDVLNRNQIKKQINKFLISTGLVGKKIDEVET